MMREKSVDSILHASVQFRLHCVINKAILNTGLLRIVLYEPYHTVTRTPYRTHMLPISSIGTDSYDLGQHNDVGEKKVSRTFAAASRFFVDLYSLIGSCRNCVQQCRTRSFYLVRLGSGFRTTAGLYATSRNKFPT